MRYGKLSREKDGNLVIPLWLVFDRQGNVRMTRNEPDVGRAERAMKLTATVPLTLFSTPTISATLTIDAPAFPPRQIDVTAAAEALKGALGCDIDVRVRDSDGPRMAETPIEAARGEAGPARAEGIAQGDRP